MSICWHHSRYENGIEVLTCHLGGQTLEYFITKIKEGEAAAYWAGILGRAVTEVHAMPEPDHEGMMKFEVSLKNPGGQIAQLIRENWSDDGIEIYIDENVLKIEAEVDGPRKNGVLITIPKEAFDD